MLCLRLLGMMDLSLREVVSNGKQSVNSALKSKKGWIMQVGVMLKFYILMIIYLRYWCMCFHVMIFSLRCFVQVRHITVPYYLQV